MKSIVTLVAAYVACIVSVSAQLDTQSGTMNDVQVIQLSEEVYYQLDSTFTFSENNGEWLVDSKTSFIYNDNRKIKESHTQAFQSNTWSNRSQIFYTYTDESKSWTKEIQNWNNNMWNKVWKKHFIQDENKNELKIAYSEWSANNWEEIWQQDQNYNSEGKLASYQTRKLDESTSQLKDYWNYSCQYDGEGNLLQVNNKSYNKESGELLDEYECILEYNSEGLLSEQIIDWDNTNNEWKIINRNTIDNSQNNITIKVSESWNEESNAWMKTMRVTETSDNSGNVFEIKRDYWDNTNEEWLPHRIDNIVYNVDGIKTEEITFYPNSSLNTWESHSKTVYHYKKVNDIEEEETTPNQDLIIYPNPADKEINLTFTGDAKQLEIYSMDGALVLQQQLPNIYQAINVSTLQAGVYIAIVTLESGQATTKFIKK
ncbi:T9SS type A sorting domain-containing protein [Carboxylicivirga sp. N1Y90]|uniref:T9SS type A sorting domain-containing protein n=1 Tax=Carboxylicivirga fragile TaxID=3417571 RepID=UPI003D32742D|nr:T9SS type A sorting domain-containing protein [Marinilabiliaceae bacterium N1Y90]